MPETDTKNMQHSVFTLQYRILEGSVSLEPLRILKERTVDWNEWTLGFYVLGASHAVRLERRETCLTELLACVHPLHTPRTLAHADRYPSELCISAHGLLIRARLNIFALTEGDALRGAFADDDHLDAAYPDLPAYAGTPFTRIGWKRTETQLAVETVHTYPEERQGVRSVTLFEKQEARR